ncbi:flagella basal body P-ring formation protein FlgA [Rhizobiales bacterium GAS188]|jgi:flagella basal body P-ring formation protein FlgA|nr:flagella basal body P-ring formation protein FlgA [Rhizobiales bacterium GAS188]
MIRHVLWAARLAAAIAIVMVGSRPVLPADLTLPVPTIVLYPGDVIRDGLLVDRDFSFDPMATGGVIGDRSVLLGKIARRTLLPGKPIPVNGVGEPKVVSNGAQVKVVFSEGGLTITTYGAALQAGSVGDLVKVRNPESGIIVTGTVQPDGSVRVSDS